MSFLRDESSIYKEPLRTDPVERAAQRNNAEAAQRVQEIMDHVRDQRTPEERQEALDELMDLHRNLSEAEADNEQAVRQAEIAFLLLLRDEPDILENTDYRTFVAKCVDQENFYRLEWETVEEVIMVAEVLYGFRFDDTMPADELTEHVRDLVRHALRQFERENAPEKMFNLLQRAPIPTSMMDAELVRLRNRLHLYEMRRVTRKKRFLYGFLGVQVLLVLLVFPLLFQRFENGQLLEQVEQATNVEFNQGRTTCTDDTPDSERYLCDLQSLSFQDSLYWSVITYGSIGYGDVAPVTTIGKLLAGLHGLMGVLSTGIIAGLILNWITPRELQ